MRPQIKVLTLGVSDLERSLAFYRDGLGLPTEGIIGQEFDHGSVVFFKMNDTLILALYRAAYLGLDANIEPTQNRLGAVSIGHNVGAKEDVDAVMDQAVQAGAVVTDAARDRFWGGYSGYFHDPDGHLWEIAWNPQLMVQPRLLQSTEAAGMNHDSYPESHIRSILQDVRTVAVVGASPNPVRPSYFVVKYLSDKGYIVFPVNPGHAGKEILGRPVYASLKDIPEPIDMVDVFRGSDAVPGIVAEALALEPRPRVVWMQLGIRHDEAAWTAEEAGLKVVMNRCPKMEYGKLSGEWGWVGGYSGALSSQRQRLHASGKMQSLGIAPQKRE